MESIFSRDPSIRPKPAPFDFERIRAEVAHTGVKTRWKQNPVMATARLLGAVVFLFILALFFLDPFVYTMRKTQAIHAYLYLRSFDQPANSEALITSGYFTPGEQQVLRNRAGDFTDYYPDVGRAQRVSTAAINYIHGLNAMHKGDTSQLDTLTRIRYYMFNALGLPPPKHWLSMDPYVDNHYDY